MIKTNIVFCFVEGEPHLYNKELKKYFPLKVDYNYVLDHTKAKITTLEKRPCMKEIWNFFSEMINCSERYVPNCSKKSYINSNSFETRFTKDITSYIDIFFKRGYTTEENAERAAAKEWLSTFYYFSDAAEARLNQILIKKKSGRKLY